MIFPSKIINIEKSLLGAGAFVLSHMQHPQSFSRLWQKTKNMNIFNSYEHFILTIDFLYIIKAIDINDDKLYRRKNVK